MCVLALITGVATAVLAGVQLSGDKSTPHAFGTPPPTAASTPSPAPTAVSADPAPRATPDRSAAASASGGPLGTTIVPAVLGAPPTSLVIPTLGVRAVVEHVETTDGELGVPENPAHVGWWIGGAMAGSAQGSVVIDGHVDSAATGPGALFSVSTLSAGDRVIITTAAGHTLTYTVTAREVLPKSADLPARLFATTGPPRLVLITCGGPFDSSVRSYQDNIVVYATPPS